MEKEKIGDIYNKDAVDNYYDVIGKDAESPEGMSDSDKYLFEILPKDLNGKAVLDLGCGNGRYSQLFCRWGAEKVVGLDLSPEMLMQAQKRKKENNLKQFEILQADLQNLPLKKEGSDIIFSRFSLMYAKNIVEVMKNIRDSLKPGGELYALLSYAILKNFELADKIKETIIPIDITVRDKTARVKNYGYTLEDYKNAIKEAGLNLTEEKFFPSDSQAAPEYEFRDFVNFGQAVLKAKKP